MNETQKAIISTIQMHVDGIKDYNEKHNRDIMIDMHTTEIIRLIKELQENVK